MAKQHAPHEYRTNGNTNKPIRSKQQLRHMDIVRVAPPNPAVEQNPFHTPRAPHKNITPKITFSIRLRRHIMRYGRGFAQSRAARDARVRLGVGISITVLVAVELLTTMQPYFTKDSYALGTAGSLLSPISQPMADKLQFDAKQQAFLFNNDYTPATPGSVGTSSPVIAATAYQEPTKGVTVTDTTDKVNFTVTPKFNLGQGQQDGNRVIYPLRNGTGWVVYSMHGIGVKEDVVLTHAVSDTVSLSYTLGLGNSLAAHVEHDGSIGIYGNTLFSGNVATGSAKDAALLQEARQNAPKTTHLFSIPKPTITTLSKKASSVQAVYTLQGNTLRVNVTGLQHAHFPLSIDPSIYVVTAQQFMNGNNETNIDFDVADKLIEKGSTTGARFNAWNATTNLPTANWGGGTVAAGGYVYSVGGATTSLSASSTVNWAQFDTSTGAINSPNPGNGTCASWCTASAYNLPSGRAGFSLVAYNGFLYALGGTNSAGTKQNTVYIAKLGANGEPRLWHPTSTNQATWVYWYQDTNLNSIRSYAAAVAYNNRMYLLGGLSASGPVNTVEVANVNPTGTLGTWTASTSLSSALYGHSAQVYNDHLYVLGGAATVGGAPVSSVYDTKINSDGTLNTWVQTTSFTTGRMSWGGTFTTSWGAYIYISGGCSAVNGSGYCTTVQSDTQVASINADGSLDIWNTVGGVSNTNIGFGMLAWRNYIYQVGGCSAQNTSTGDCNASMRNGTISGTINQDGDASTVSQSVASGTAPCSGVTPTNCNLPGTANIGNMLPAAVITNGYLYVIGGCTNNTCSTTMGNVAYVAISSDGGMSKPATCPSGGYQGGTWCVDNVHTISGGIAASSPVIFGGRIYLVGGLNGTANTNNINYTSVNSDGSVAGWATAQSLTGLGATSVSYLYAYARANPASASTNPGNLYIFGGCTASSAAGCTNYTQNVYKCNIGTSGAIATCSTTGQQQIGIVPGDSQTGLGIMSGTVYANYIYLIGGVSPNQTDLKTVRYAKFDNNNNVVSADGSGTWVESTNQMSIGRRRAAAFGYNGNIYVVGGYDGTGGGGVLADIEFIKINVSDGSLGSAGSGFNVSSVTINQRWGLSVPISNSYAYVIGGCANGASPGSCTARTDVVQTFQIYNNNSGSPGGYSTAANTYATSANRIGASSIILNGYIYVAGGCTSATDCTTAVSDVSYAPIDVNGAIGAWASTTAALPAVRTWGKLEASGGTLYYIGGQSSTATDWRTEVYYATPSSGNITTWNTATNGLPFARTQFGASVWNSRIYVLGGIGNSTGCTANVCNTVYVSPQLSSGGNITAAWSTTSTSFNVPRSGLATITYANNIYVLGGYDGTNYLSDSQYAQISTANGSVGAWSYSSSLPQALSQGDGFAANGYMYLIGGRTAATTCAPVTLVAPISANTTIASGNKPTGIGEWYQTNQRYTGNRYGAGAVYSNGKAYVLGGGCGSTLTYASPVTQQTVLLSQPQVAKYSIMIDTDSDVFPNQWLLNGLDNSIGASWQLAYRSMTNTTTSCTTPAMTTWGQVTNFGNVTLGTPGVYIPKDGSGVSTNCARFYYLAVTIDSSQAYGYPDDITRGPTITDLTLQFTADPSKRLMHGRTFTGGLQQPDDTPYYAH